MGISITDEEIQTALHSDGVSNFLTMHEAREKAADIKHKEIMEADNNKTLLELFPKEFNPKSYIGKEVLRSIEKTKTILNSCEFYDGRQFTDKEVARYMMQGVTYDKFVLARKFIPKIDSHKFFSDFLNTVSSLKDSDPDLYESRINDYLSNDPSYNGSSDVEYYLRLVIQSWESFEQRQAVKNRTKDFEIEKDGYPRTGRGNMCYAFYPIKGDLSSLEVGKTYELYSHRSKSTAPFKITGKRDGELEFKAIYKDKEVFLCEYEQVANSWGALFTINQQIYSGWWNRIFEFK